MARTAPALELKGRMLSTTRLRVLKADLAAIEDHLADLARQMPQAIKGMAVVLESEEALDLDSLLRLLRGQGIQTLGVTEGPLAAAATAAGLAVLPRDGRGSRAEPPPAPAAPAAAVAPPPRRDTRIVTEPVRSGQQIYAENADLVVLSAVSPGAEVIADGCVHVYGLLRGRAIAGARGDTAARIFVRRFEAELVAVAGVYAVAEQMKDRPRGEPAQVLLRDGKLAIESLGS
ncbi:MAG: septum site-determining protein MinC [Stagnimonas sp.]|nr:septum site-determining protein MinC [Stagnimonas sp.]